MTTTTTPPLGTIHGTLIDLTALAGLLSHALVHERHVHPDDRDKPDLGAVTLLLHRELERLRDQVEALT